MIFFFHLTCYSCGSLISFFYFFLFFLFSFFVPEDSFLLSSCHTTTWGKVFTGPSFELILQGFFFLYPLVGFLSLLEIHQWMEKLSKKQLMFFLIRISFAPLGLTVMYQVKVLEFWWETARGMLEKVEGNGSVLVNPYSTLGPPIYLFVCLFVYKYLIVFNHSAFIVLVSLK